MSIWCRHCKEKIVDVPGHSWVLESSYGVAEHCPHEPETPKSVSARTRAQMADVAYRMRASGMAGVFPDIYRYYAGWELAG